MHHLVSVGPAVRTSTAISVAVPTKNDSFETAEA